MKKTVYIAGKIGNVPVGHAPTRQKFDNAQAMLRRKGYDTINPMTLYHPKGDRRENIMRRDLLAMLNQCDAIYLLPDWPDSEGAKLELSVATACGLEVMGGRE